LLKPQPEHLIGAIGADAKGDVDGLLRTMPSPRIFNRIASKKASG
jgi:hypothetical protein